MKRRFWSVCLALALCWTLLPATALAADVAPNELWVGGTNVVQGGYWTTNADGSLTASDNSHYNVYYDGNGNQTTQTEAIQTAIAKGTSMLEDSTYNLVKGKEGILEAHMLEICPTIADGPISIKCQPLSMGDREDPARLVFTSKEGHGIATSLIDLGNRFRLIINDVNCKKVEKPMPKLPVATNFWTPEPDMYTGAEAWILAGGAHHTAFTYDLTAEQMGDWAAMMGIEAVYIDKDTKIRDLKRDLMLGEVFYR